jgi:hypothetical protein
VIADVEFCFVLVEEGQDRAEREQLQHPPRPPKTRVCDAQQGPHVEREQPSLPTRFRRESDPRVSKKFPN